MPRSPHPHDGGARARALIDAAEDTRGLSAARQAAFLGVHPSTLCRWASGSVALPPWAALLLRLLVAPRRSRARILDAAIQSARRRTARARAPAAEAQDG